jgi:asparagine synthase (glutamine-hydrolysing)
LKSWADEILDPIQIKKDGFFDEKMIRGLWQEHQERRANHAKKLWTIIVYQHWLHTVFPGMKN